MEAEIARMLNVNSSDKQKLNELLQDYLLDDNVESDSESDTTDNEVSANDDDNDGDVHDEVFDMLATDCELALKNAANFPEQLSGNDETELRKSTDFRCNCTYFNGTPCSLRYAAQEMVTRRLAMSSMEPRDQMLVLLGKISCGINLSSLTSSSKRAGQNVRERQRSTYWLEGQQLCHETFRFLHGVSKDRLSALHQWYKQEGLMPKEKKNGGRANNTHALVMDDIKRVVQFLTNYADINALVLPGRVPGFKRDDIKLLPSSHTKVKVYADYVNSLKNLELRTVGESSFLSLWQQLMPFVVSAKPMTDLCWTCQKNNALIYKGVNIPESEKSSRLKLQEEHLHLVDTERSLYNKMVEDARAVCRDAGLTELQQSAPCSRSLTMHYSFDYAQQVHLPSNPQQPGPIYFLVPRKCGLFGVCCEGLPRQVNFIIDEAQLISKGSNAVISYLHYFFENFGFGETDVHLHCDNCSGQNKNRFVMWYCAWRVATGLHKSITVNFMIAGHTKFAPDWCFGLLKKAFRRHAVSSLTEMESVVNESASANQAQLVGKEDGTSYVPTGDWQTHLNPYFRPLPGIKKHQHFRYDSNSPGMVFYRSTGDLCEKSFNLFRADVDSRQLPQQGAAVIKPPGLDGPRQEYLYRHIREFVTEPWKDVMCPLPGTVFPTGFSKQKAAAALDDSDVSSPELETDSCSHAKRNAKGKRKVPEVETVNNCVKKRAVEEGKGRGGGRGRGRGRGKSAK